MSGVNAPSAHAACHQFRITASPSTVQEGERVTVTVTRDAPVNPSSIEVARVDQSARAGADYTAVKKVVSFTAETEQTFTVPTTEDTASETNETFALRLSNPAGCPANTRFDIGPDAVVTVADDDAAPATTVTTKPAAAATSVAPRTGVGGPRTTALVDDRAASTTTTEVAVPPTVDGLTAESTTTAEPNLVVGKNAGSSDGGMGAPAFIIGGLVVLGAAAVAAALWVRSRRSPPLSS